MVTGGMCGWEIFEGAVGDQASYQRSAISQRMPYISASCLGRPRNSRIEVRILSESSGFWDNGRMRVARRRRTS